MQNDQVDLILGQHCIIHLANGQILCRVLKKGDSEGLFHLLCLNIETRVATPVIYNANIISAALVIWHRKMCFLEKVK